MKKFILFFLSILFFAQMVYGAGACPLTSMYTSLDGLKRTLYYTCTADDSDGSFPSITIPESYVKDFYLYSTTTWPGATAPTDDSDYTILDASTGEDLMGANGTDGIDATTIETHLPKTAAQNVNFYHQIDNTALTLVITNNVVNSAIIYFKIKLVK